MADRSSGRLLARAPSACEVGPSVEMRRAASPYSRDPRLSRSFPPPRLVNLAKLPKCLHNLYGGSMGVELSARTVDVLEGTLEV